MPSDLPHVYEDTPNPPTSVDPERIWLEPRQEDGIYGCEGRLWCEDDDPAGIGEPWVEYVRADLYDKAKVNGGLAEVALAESRLQCHEMADHIASLERELEEARERAGLFEGLPIRGVHVCDEDLDADWSADLWWKSDGRVVWEVYDVSGQRVDGEYETLTECLTALRTALASHSVEEDTDE